MFKSNTLIGGVTIFALALGLVSLAEYHAPFASSELAFTDTVSDGLVLVPASCPSDYGFDENGEACSPDNRPPSAPSVSASGSCIVGVPFSLSVSASDPEGDSVNIFGNIDGTPLSIGPFASGSVRTLSWQFATEGTHRVFLRSSDIFGAIGGAVVVSFSCSENDDGDGIIIEDDGGGGNGEFGGDALDVLLLIDAVPRLVKSGSTTRVFWASENATECEVNGSNGDVFHGEEGPTDGQESGPITEKTSFVLTCRDSENNLISSNPVFVYTAPIWSEF